VTGERLWYALHGYDLQTPPSGRGMYGHGRVLPPDYRTIEHAKSASRLLIVKAARRMRRDGWNAGRVWLWLELMDDSSVHRAAWLPAVHDGPARLPPSKPILTRSERIRLRWLGISNGAI
jgi:DNA polymerase IV